MVTYNKMLCQKIGKSCEGKWEIDHTKRPQRQQAVTLNTNHKYESRTNNKEVTARPQKGLSLQSHTKRKVTNRSRIGQYLDIVRVHFNVKVIHEELPALGLDAEALRTLAVVAQPHKGQPTLRPISKLHFQNILPRRWRHHAADWKKGSTDGSMKSFLITKTMLLKCLKHKTADCTKENLFQVDLSHTESFLVMDV